MNYVITYCADTQLFMEELEQLAPHYIITNDEGNKSWVIQTTPIIKSPNGTLAMSILTDHEIEFVGGMKTIKSLGTYDELFADDKNHAIYKSVYPYDVPLSYVDEDGTTIEYFRPQKIGEFIL